MSGVLLDVGHRMCGNNQRRQFPRHVRCLADNYLGHVQLNAQLDVRRVNAQVQVRVDDADFSQLDVQVRIAHIRRHMRVDGRVRLERLHEPGFSWWRSQLLDDLRLC